MVVTFAGYDIKVGTPVVARDGAEVGTVLASDGDNLIVGVRNNGGRMLVSERGVAGFEPDFVRLDQDADWILSGRWNHEGSAAVAPEPQVAGPQVTTDVTTSSTNGANVIDGTVEGDDEEAPAATSTSDPTHVIDLHSEDLVAAKREVATGVVRVRKKVVVDDSALDVDVFDEKVRVTRTDLDRELDTEHLFEESSFEIELRSEEVEVSKRVRVVGQVELGKDRIQRTERVTGQVRREEVEVDEVTYPAARQTDSADSEN
ncbi:YsnF/AvaK domain-containing protein [Gordonia soli]|uniref:DUF2382 domain-containing protein n=1 Tax=Gordonia soli NBRC 108243 TaxID=1223545 RepID=M0QN76_9ACTN|nr:YsnF/AvaK domain-containing protein [Gordonia soli]GAC69746.1 hypothetical protein GS4_27_00240 [Gordonia soli NBRC 108243]